MTLEQTDYQGNENIGFYGVVSDAYALFAREFKHRDLFDNRTEGVLIGGTRLIGLFAAGNSQGVLVPDIISEHEKQKLDDAGIEYMMIESRFTALGNLVLCNDNGCLLSSHLEEHAEKISEFLGVPTETGTVAGLNIVGSCGITTNDGVLLHRDATEDELEHAEKVLGVEGDIGSVNFGSPYIHSGLLANSEDLLIGPNTTGPEIQRIQDALGFL